MSNLGELKIFLGYAPGVGKTYTMLNEGNRRLSRGDDVIIGHLEHHNRPDTLEQVKNLEVFPLKKDNPPLLDLEGIIKRKPTLVLIDELAFSNPKEAKNKKRYLDILEILEFGINVYTTLNLQHLESLNDIIYQITKIKTRETVPDTLINNATVVLVDLPPDALRNRIKRGNIYDRSIITSSLSNFFRKGNLIALRELSLRQVADEIDVDLNKYKLCHNLNENWNTVERIMVAISSSPSSKRLIRAASRLALKYHSDFYCIYVENIHSFSPKLSPEDLNALEENFLLSKSLQGKVVYIKGKNPSYEIIKFAKEKNITKLLLGHSRRTPLQSFIKGSLLNDVLNGLRDTEVIILPNSKNP